MGQSIIQLYQNEQLASILQLQDEKDRHSIALWGVKNTSRIDTEKYKSNIDPTLISGEVSLKI